MADEALYAITSKTTREVLPPAMLRLHDALNVAYGIFVDHHRNGGPLAGHYPGAEALSFDMRYPTSGTGADGSVSRAVRAKCWPLKLAHSFVQTRGQRPIASVLLGIRLDQPDGFAEFEGDG